MKKVLVITYYWPPSGGAGVQRWVKFIKYFKDQNINPYIISVDPDFASYPVIDNSLINDIPENTNVYLTKTNEPYSFYRKINNNQTPYAGFANEGNTYLTMAKKLGADAVISKPIEFSALIAKVNELLN